LEVMTFTQLRGALLVYGDFAKNISYRVVHTDPVTFDADMRFSKFSVEPLPEVNKLFKLLGQNICLQFTAQSGSGKTTTLLGVAQLKYCLYIEASCVDYYKKKRMSSDKQFSHLVETIKDTALNLQVKYFDVEMDNFFCDLQQSEAMKLITADYFVARQLLLSNYLQTENPTSRDFYYYS
jgi:hypothetical protein